MFANIKFTKKHSPKFHDAFVGDPEKDDIPDDATGALANVYDYIYGVSLLPEDAIRLIRWLNTLVSAMFDDANYIRKLS